MKFFQLSLPPSEPRVPRNNPQSAVRNPQSAIGNPQSEISVGSLFENRYIFRVGLREEKPYGVTRAARPCDSIGKIGKRKPPPQTGGSACRSSVLFRFPHGSGKDASCKAQDSPPGRGRAIRP